MATGGGGSEGASGPGVAHDADAATARYESAVKAAEMDDVHAALAMGVWEPQAAIPPKRVRDAHAG